MSKPKKPVTFAEQHPKFNWRDLRNETLRETGGAAIGFVLETHPVLPLHGRGVLSITDVYKDDPRGSMEPLFRVTGYLTVAAVKQLMVGTEFRLRAVKKPA